MPNIPVPKTWVDGDFATAPVMNTEIRDILNFLLNNRPVFAARRSATLSLTSGTQTVIPWDVRIIDSAGGWSATNPSRYTIQYPGKYKVSIVGAIQGSTGGGERTAWARINGSATRWKIASQAPINSAAAITTVVSSIVLPYTFAIGEYIEFQVMQTSGSTLNFAAADDSFCSIEWIGS